MWHGESGDTSLLLDTDDDDVIVTSVAWKPSHEGQGYQQEEISDNKLAVGTSSKQIQLWDVETSQCIRTFSGQHSGRVSSLAWNGPNMLSSGSLDSMILHNDIRMANSLICRFEGHK